MGVNASGQKRPNWRLSKLNLFYSNFLGLQHSGSAIYTIKHFFNVPVGESIRANQKNNDMKKKTIPSLREGSREALLISCNSNLR